MATSWSVTWTLTNSGGPGSSQATLSGQIVAPVVVQDLVSQWRLDNSDGVTFPDTGPAGIPMTLVGTWQNLELASMVTGLTGTSAATGKAGAYATIPANQAAHALAALTLSLYFQRNSALDKQIIFALGDPNVAAIGDLSIEVLQTGLLRAYHVGGDGVLRFFEGPNGITGTNLAEGVAHRIDLTLGAAGAKIYLDGTPLSAATIAANTNGWDNAVAKYLGIYTDGISVPANGAFDQIRLYNRQFSDAEVAAFPAAVSIAIPALAPVAVGGTFADVAQNSTLIVDVLAAAGTYYQLTPTLTVNSGGATVDTSGSRPRLNISTTTTGAKTITWTLTHSAGAGSSQGTTTGNVVAVVASALPLVPKMDFIPGDAAVPGSNVVYVYNTSLGNGSGSSPANAREIQAAINAATAGQTLVAIAAQPGGTTVYPRSGGLVFSSSGASGNPKRLMARPGDTVILSMTEEFAAFRNISSGTGSVWQSYDSNKKIWRSVSTGFGGTVRPLSGFWREFGCPHMIQSMPTMAALQNPAGTGDVVYQAYSGPCALVNSDGRIYIRMQIPSPARMSKNGKWPKTGVLGDWPGAINSSGQIAFPVTEDPRDYEIWLTTSLGTSVDATRSAYIFNSGVSYWTIGDGINSVGYDTTLYMANSNVGLRLNRGTDLCVGIGMNIQGSGSTGLTLNRRRMGVGSLNHTPLNDWKFGGYYSGETAGRNPPEISARPYGFAVATSNAATNLSATDCTFYGYHDMHGGPGGGYYWSFWQCTFYRIYNDGFQCDLSHYNSFNIHYCYFLDSAVGGPGGYGINTGSHKISHNIVDYRILCKFGIGDEEPFSVGFDPIHVDYSQTCSDPRKIYNNTFILATEAAAQQGGCLTYHIRGAKPNFGDYQEYWNNIACIVCDNRYIGVQFAAWQGPNDGPIFRMITSGSKEAHDYCMIWRDCPPWPVSGSYGSGTITAGNYMHGLIMAVNTADVGEQNFYSIAAWKASGYFNTSKTKYAPGYHNSSIIQDPQIPSAVRSPATFDIRRDYRPRASNAASMARATTGTTIAGESTAGWLVLPSPWVGALDPSNTTSCPVGVQNP